MNDSVTAITVENVGTCDHCDDAATTMYVITSGSGETRYEFECDAAHDVDRPLPITQAELDALGYDDMTPCAFVVPHQHVIHCTGTAMGVVIEHRAAHDVVLPCCAQCRLVFIDLPGHDVVSFDAVRHAETD